VHPRLTILARRSERARPPEQELDELARGGAERVGLSGRKVLAEGVDDVVAAVERAGLSVTHLGLGPILPLADPRQLERARKDVRNAIDAAVALGASSVYGPPGGAPSLEWEVAAAAFADGVAPIADHAHMRGVALLIEPTISLFADMSIVHTLADAADLAERAGIGVCLDIQHCWSERGLRAAIRRAAPRTGLVQLSDWVAGTRHHFRAVPGEGAIPLERIVGWILEDGYAGLFDLELDFGEGDAATETVSRAIAAAGALLERLGA
jgi:sugar phosphate isomerase/epimerase